MPEGLLVKDLAISTEIGHRWERQEQWQGQQMIEENLRVCQNCVTYRSIVAPCLVNKVGGSANTMAYTTVVHFGTSLTIAFASSTSLALHALAYSS